MIIIPIQTPSYDNLTDEQAILNLTSVLVFTILFGYLMYLEDKYSILTKRSPLISVLVASILLIIVSIAIGYFITYLIF